MNQATFDRAARYSPRWVRPVWIAMASLAVVAPLSSVRGEGLQSVLPPVIPSLSSGSYVARYDAATATVAAGQVTLLPNLHPSGFQATLNAAPAAHHTGGGPSLLSSPGVINGLPYMRFVNANSVGLQSGQLAGGDVIPNTTPLTIFHVGRLNGLPIDQAEWYDGRTATSRKTWLYDGVNRTPGLFSTATGLAPSLLARPTDNQFHIFTATFDGAASAIGLDGVVETLLSSPGAHPFDGITIGSRHAFFAPLNSNLGIDGDLAELIVVSGNLNTDDFNAIGSYLEAKFGLNTAFPDLPQPALAPEPGSIVLFGLAVLGWAGWYYRRRGQRAAIA